MIRISQIKIPVTGEQNDLEKIICRMLQIRPAQLKGWSIAKRSIEARRKESLSYVYSVDVRVDREEAVLKRCRRGNVAKAKKIRYAFPVPGSEALSERPVVIGSGPAGLFCAYLLAQAGFAPIVLERGERMEERKKTVEAFWQGGKLDPESNVQFGEGGAGTFSDGKLNSGIHDKEGRMQYVLHTFAAFGAPEEILYDAKPHIGTDILYDVVRNLRNKILELGGEFRFQTKARELRIQNGALTGIGLSGGEVLETKAAVLAIGHSARDTMFMLQSAGIRMEPKAFAVGVRIQHPQELINRAQWGEDYPESLGAAPYKLTARAQDGRGVYTFCMCPGGHVVNASSEEGFLAVNGMSYSGRDSGFANSALLVTVDPRDYLSMEENGVPEELRAITFQRRLEKKAFAAAAGRIPVQRLEDFAADRISSSGSVLPCTKGAWDYADVRGIFPEFIARDLTEGVSQMGTRLQGFDLPDALLMGVESRTSSPVRILRDESGQSSLPGLYPCGEGAGYAGGILSAAVDGMKIAEKIIRRYQAPYLPVQSLT